MIGGLLLGGLPMLVKRSTNTSKPRNTGCAAPFGAVRTDERFVGCRDEAIAVARAEGARVDAEAARAFHDKVPAAMRSSMQKDLAAGHQPELDVIAGPIIRAGKRHGIPTPNTATLAAEIGSHRDRLRCMARVRPLTHLGGALRGFPPVRQFSTKAVAPARVGASMLVRLAPLAVCSFVVATDGTLVVGLLGRVGGAISASAAETGQGITVFAIAYALGSPGLVAATRRWPPKRLLLFGLLVFAAANAATGAAASLADFLVARGMAGLAAGLVTPMAATIASVSSREDEQGRALAIVVGGASVAAVIGVPIGTAAGVFLGWRVAFFAVAALGLVLVGVLARQPLPRELSPCVPSRLRGRRTAIGLTLSVTLLWSAGSFTFFSYLTLVLRTAAGVAGSGVALELMLFGAAGVVGAYLSGKLTDNWGAVRVAAAALLTMTISQIAFALLAASTLAETALATLASVLLGAYALATWAVTPAQQHRLVSLAPQATRLLLSLNATALYTGVAIGSAAGGAVIATTDSVVALCLVSAALGFASMLTLITSTRAARPPQPVGAPED